MGGRGGLSDLACAPTLPPPLLAPRPRSTLTKHELPTLSLSLSLPESILARKLCFDAPDFSD
eukprot:9484829-Pyramimonas_sp.AAC.1